MNNYISLKKLGISMLCIALITVVLLPHRTHVSAKQLNLEGFTIQAERVEGQNMTPGVVIRETSAKRQQPMIRFQYEKAIIYGMKLTKELQTPNGPVTIVLEAQGPVEAKKLTVDTSAFSFKGACLNTGTLIPQPALEDVTMVAHYMNAEMTNLENLSLRTVSGTNDLQKPEKLKVLQDMEKLSADKLTEEVNKMMSGNLPLTCPKEEQKKEETQPSESPSVPSFNTEKPAGLSEKAKEQIKDTSGQIHDAVDQVKAPIKDQVDEVTKPIKDKADQLKPPLQKVTSPVKQVLDQAKDALSKIDSITQTNAKVSQTVSASCKKIEEAKGNITEHLLLELIQQAKTERKPLSQLCSYSPSITKELEILEKELSKTLGIDIAPVQNQQTVNSNAVQKLEQVVLGGLVNSGLNVNR